MGGQADASLGHGRLGLWDGSIVVASESQTHLQGSTSGRVTRFGESEFKDRRMSLVSIRNRNLFQTVSNNDGCRLIFTVLNWSSLWILEEFWSILVISYMEGLAKLQVRRMINPNIQATSEEGI